MIRENTLEIMNNIIQDYLTRIIDRCQAVERLINNVDIDYVHDVWNEKSTQEDLFVVDCYYTIKHLTHSGYETTDEELRYFVDCFNGKRIYNKDDKFRILQNYLAVQNDE